MADKPARVQIAHAPVRTVLRLKSWLPEHTARGKLFVVAGQALPRQVGATMSDSMRVLCIGSCEWLIVSATPGVREHIDRDLPSQGLGVADLTDGLGVLEVRGPAAPAVLSKGCGLDFHPQQFPVGRCARTRFVQIPVVIDCLDEAPQFELYVGRSHAGYLKSCIDDAAREFS